MNSFYNPSPETINTRDADYSIAGRGSQTFFKTARFISINRRIVDGEERDIRRGAAYHDGRARRCASVLWGIDCDDGTAEEPSRFKKTVTEDHHKRE